MTAQPFDKHRFLMELIADIDTVSSTAQRDLGQLNNIANELARHHDDGKISDLHYTVDRERLNRTISKCKKLIWSLSNHRVQALELLKE